MASHSRLNRRFVLPFALALVLAGEVTGLALAVRLQPLAAAVPAADTSSGLTASASRDHAPRDPAAPSRSAEPGIRTSSAYGALARPVVASIAKGPSTTTTRAVATSRQTAAAAPAHRGRNHVWIPALGINRSIASFACSRSRPPDNYLYRWGCAGTNNVYLLGHAYSVFKPLHDAYVGGRLKKGMKVFYADGNGRVRTYSVVWWKVTPPTTSASWAWAAQSRPSMTLQTCLGANSQYRLMVRLVAVN
jgi:sortase (surface protein transpeptidase)